MACVQVRAQIFVKQGSNGNGSSWQQAYGDLQAALRVVQAGQEIWVATGTYTPSTRNERSAAFDVPSNVKLYGGFAGHERSREDRNPQLYPTVLSGNIGSTASEDNSYTVVRFINASSQTLLDGFIIEGGYADDTNHKIGHERISGAGIFVKAKQSSSSPRIINCTLRNNFAYYGAGIFNDGALGACRTSIVNTKFYNNTAKIEGGGIFNQGTDGICDVTIVNCHFDANLAFYGGGMMNSARGSGRSNPSVTDCLFTDNSAEIDGSDYFNARSGQGIVKPILRGCRMENSGDNLMDIREVEDKKKVALPGRN